MITTTTTASNLVSTFPARKIVLGVAGWFAQVPATAPGELERWLISGAAALTLAALVRKVFGRKSALEAEFMSQADFRLFRQSVETEAVALREKIDARYFSLAEKIETLQREIVATAERRDTALQQRLSDLSGAVARLDERTRPPRSHTANPSNE